MGGQIQREYYAHMYVNGKMSPAKTIPGMWREE
jgi:hypothetical protein